MINRISRYICTSYSACAVEVNSYSRSLSFASLKNLMRRMSLISLTALYRRPNLAILVKLTFASLESPSPAGNNIMPNSSSGSVEIRSNQNHEQIYFFAIKRLSSTI